MQCRVHRPRPADRPNGGLKASGIGKEGPRSAVAEMTDVKTVILHGRPW
jgi:glyceraldehyde-3-phosphate dehydrogenase (NADP+)